ncbi:MAG: 1-deoxy-D-xylulose-5-phosphate synthase, partial [Eubacterium sp.]|nr:1-deoxy-D-xylulose-5-phosphate synthase [Eubacterium sp.]
TRFADTFPKRFFDVGIAEQHAVTFSAGLARNGMLPVFAVYSTFLQRSYDQLIHDVAMQKLKVIFCIDRSGFVGSDGESHHGLFDTSFLMSVPDLTVFSPSCFEELRSMLYQALYKEKYAVAIRYPRGGECIMPEGYTYEKEDYTVFGDESNPKCIVTYGREFEQCRSALDSIDGAYIIKLNKIKPLNPSVYEHIQNAETVFFFEEGIKSGGVGEVFAAGLEEYGIKAAFRHICVNDEFVKHASVDAQIKKYRLDKASVIEEVNGINE